MRTLLGPLAAAVGAAALAAVGAAALAAAAVEIDWHGGVFVHEASAPAGKFIELCGRLGAGETVRWSFDVSGAVDFNIHYHDGDDVVYPERRTHVARDGGTLHPQRAQTYCWMWHNRGAAPVELKVELRR